MCQRGAHQLLDAWAVTTASLHRSKFSLHITVDNKVATAAYLAREERESGKNRRISAFCRQLVLLCTNTHKIAGRKDRVSRVLMNGHSQLTLYHRTKITCCGVIGFQMLRYHRLMNGHNHCATKVLL